MKFHKNIRSIFCVTFALVGVLGAYVVTSANTATWSKDETYSRPRTQVFYSKCVSGSNDCRVGAFENAWYVTAGTEPNFENGANGWNLVGDAVHVTTLDAAQGVVKPRAWSSSGTYFGNDVVSYNNACYKAKWWTQSNPTTSGSPWEALTTCPQDRTVDNPLKTRLVVAIGNPTKVVDLTVQAVNDVLAAVGAAGSSTTTTQTSSSPTTANPVWVSVNVYLAGSVIQHTFAGDQARCYKAKWWTSGNEPTPATLLATPWDSPWEQLGSCPQGDWAAAVPPTVPTSADSNSVDAAVRAAAEAPAAAGTTEAASSSVASAGVAVPPVIPGPAPAATAVTDPAPTTLPSDGYSFLRKLTQADWNWMFPLRSGYLVAGYEGGTRNQLGGSDPFSLDAFIRSVLEYNNWAKINGYKQFLNEGTVKQQAEEFLVFWAKSSRETSGSWDTAPVKKGGWIESETFGSETMDVWKGGLYWVEEVGYSSNADGTSTAIGYVDQGSTDFPPVSGRSYYGRGVIQLSWNYNYGAFSKWMFDNGLFKTAKDSRGVCKVDRWDRLLINPNLVADCGDLSILSGIWFWMTPQGAKPSSHDVLYGEVVRVSASTQDQGLPQTNDGYVPKVAASDTADAEVFAFRLGTVINIVNGGLECNKSSAWHGGPPQRVAYYNAYAAYINHKYSLGAARVAEATNVWKTKVSANSPLNLRSATCYNQKSYYGW